MGLRDQFRDKARALEQRTRREPPPRPTEKPPPGSTPPLKPLPPKTGGRDTARPETG